MGLFGGRESDQGLVVWAPSAQYTGLAGAVVWRLTRGVGSTDTIERIWRGAGGIHSPCDVFFAPREQVPDFCSRSRNLSYLGAICTVIPLCSDTYEVGFLLVLSGKYSFRDSWRCSATCVVHVLCLFDERHSTFSFTIGKHDHVVRFLAECTPRSCGFRVCGHLPFTRFVGVSTNRRQQMPDVFLRFQRLRRLQ